MKPIYFIFGLLLILAGITIFVLTTEPPQNAAGIAHASIKGLNVGGDGTARLATIGDAPFYFQIVVILLSTCLLYMGVPERRQDGLFKFMMAVACGYSLFIWYMIYSGYEDYLATGVAEVSFGFPTATNWFLWGVWSGFLVFNLLYVFAFRRYFLHPDDELAFKELLEELEAEKTADAAAQSSTTGEA